MQLLNNQIENYRLFEIIQNLTELDASIKGGKMDLTKNVFDIKTDLVRAVEVTAAATGVNGVHSLLFTAPVVGEIYHLTIDHDELDKGQPLPNRFSVVARTTSADDLRNDFYDVITGNPKYADMPFNVFKEGSGGDSGTIYIVEDPLSPKIAGEVDIFRLVGDAAWTASLNITTANVYDDGGDTAGVAHVDAIGQPAQLTNIANIATLSNDTPSVTPAIRFIGTVNSGTVYTVVIVSYYSETKQGNPVSEAADPLYRDVLFIDEAMTGFAYVKSIMQHLGSITAGGDGDVLQLTAAATAPTNGAIIAGAVAGKATPGTAGHDVSLSGDFPVGAEVSVTNGHATNALEVDPAADETINGGSVGDVYSIAGDKTATLRKVSGIDWVVVSEVQAP